MTATRALSCLAAVLPAIASLVAAAAPPRVDMVYVDPARFSDVRDGYTPTPAARDFFLAEIRRFIEREAAARLADDEVLQVTITNVELAGDYLARRPESTNVRVIREVNPARIDLAFRVGREGAVLREGTRTLRSTGYPVLVGVTPSDPLLYEKALLDAWLRDDLPQPRRP